MKLFEKPIKAPKGRNVKACGTRHRLQVIIFNASPEGAE
jgi:hypothetical protein